MLPVEVVDVVVEGVVGEVVGGKGDVAVVAEVEEAVEDLSDAAFMEEEGGNRHHGGAE